MCFISRRNHKTNLANTFGTIRICQVTIEVFSNNYYQFIFLVIPLGTAPLFT